MNLHSTATHLPSRIGLEAARDVSVIVPVYNERENLAPLLDEIEAAIRTMAEVSAEVIFVDDGSRDGSAEVLRELAGESAARAVDVRVIELRRNYGQTAALDAGIRVAEGRVLIPIDADRQNDPADIPRMLAEIARGADVVSGWRKERKDRFFTRKLPSAIANRIIAKLTGVRIRDFGCTLKAYRREVIADVRLYGEMHRFIPAHAKWNGAHVVELAVNHRPRTWGKSKYGLSRTLRVVLDLITVLFLQGRYIARPLHLFGSLGFLAFGLGFAIGLYLTLEKLLLDATIGDRPLLLLGVLLLILGAGAVAVGLLAELLTRIYHATAHRPYEIAGCRNVTGQPTPEEARALSPALSALAAADAQQESEGTAHDRHGSGESRG